MAMNKIRMLVKRLEGYSKMPTPHSETYYKYVREAIKELRKLINQLETEIDYEEYGEDRKQFAETFGNADTVFNQWK